MTWFLLNQFDLHKIVCVALKLGLQPNIPKITWQILHFFWCAFIRQKVLSLCTAVPIFGELRFSNSVMYNLAANCQFKAGQRYETSVIMTYIPFVCSVVQGIREV